MPNMNCPLCKAYSQIEIEYRDLLKRATRSDLPDLHHAVFRCVSCEKFFAGIARSDDTIAIHWPQNPVGKEFLNVDDNIAAAASEAHQCLSIEAYRSAIGTARSVLEATAKSKGISSGSLEKKIDAMADAGIIDKLIQETAHELRHWGNDAAHGDLASQPVSEVEAAEVVALMDVILEHVFQRPATLAQIRKSRESRKPDALTKSSTLTTTISPSQALPPGRT